MGTNVDLLAGIEAKLRRATEHVNQFRSEADAFLQDAWSIDLTWDPSSALHVARFRVRAEPPPRLGVLAGEAVGQCRSVLDHLLAAAVRLDRPALRKPPHFPIFRAKTGPDGWLAPKKDGSRQALQPILRAALLDVVERAQPFKFGRDGAPGHWLSELQAFSNQDKHDVVQGTYIAGAGMFRTRLDNRNVKRLTRMLPEGMTNLRDGLELFSVGFHDEGDVFVPFQMSVEIHMLVDGHRTGAPSLEHLIWCTANLVDDFRRAAPEFQPVRERDIGRGREWDELMIWVDSQPVVRE